MHLPLDKLVRVSQELYESWDGRMGGFGLCGYLARTWAKELDPWYAVCMDVWTDPPHCNLWVTDGKTVLEVDYPWQEYEEYSKKLDQWKWCWYKKYGAIFVAERFIVKPITGEDRISFIEEANSYIQNV